MRTALLHTIADIRNTIAQARSAGHAIGFVPTMGALHDGHGKLISEARRQCGHVAVSIFVNPIQFDRGDDFDRYPRTLDTDLKMCAQLGADAVFAPSAAEMYPARQLTFVEVSELGDGLCGEFRPGHFRGVATVVAKLFNIVQPDRAYFGEKDAQQLAIIARMVTDLSFACEIIAVPTVRESDGLAMSSRNARLSPEERRIASVIYEALRGAGDSIRARRGPVDARLAASTILQRYPEIRVEYLEIVDPATMQPVEQITGAVRVITAAWIGQTRLIDNVLCQPDAL